MKKIRVLIVEDEPPTARFIKMLVEKEEGFAVEALCESAEEAVEFFRNGGSVQVVFSDIRMAEMDGLALLRYLREQEKRIHLAIISGYKMFEYAKEAIKLNIEDYITKPIDPEEFSRLLQRIRSLCLADEYIRIQESLEKALLHKDEQEFGNCIKEGTYGLMAVFQNKNMEKLKAELEKSGAGPVFYYKEILLFLYEEGKGCRQAVLRNPAETQTIVEVSSLAFHGDGVAKIRKIYKFVLQKTVFEKQRWKVYGAYEEVEKEILDFTWKVPESIRMNLHAGNFKETKREIALLTEKWKKKEASVYEIKAGLKLLWEVLGNRDAGGDMAFSEVFPEILRECPNYEALSKWLLTFLDTFLQEEDKGKKRNREEEVFVKIKALISDRMDQNYSLAEISILFGISQPYIRKIFKKYTGNSYNEYVLEEKLRFAQGLIDANPDILIKNVADAIGVEQFYFSKIFNKRMGMSPSQYKALAKERLEK